MKRLYGTILAVLAVATCAVGVETGPGAMCCWEISAKGVPEKA